jgi:hypothetical protein
MSKHQPDTNKTYTPQPSTPIERAGSKEEYWNIGILEDESGI